MLLCQKGAKTVANTQEQREGIVKRDPSQNSSTHFIRECGSTLYVGLARAVSPTNTNFRLTFLLTRLQEARYEGLAV